MLESVLEPSLRQLLRNRIIAAADEVRHRGVLAVQLRLLNGFKQGHLVLRFKVNDVGARLDRGRSGSHVVTRCLARRYPLLGLLLCCLLGCSLVLQLAGVLRCVLIIIIHRIVERVAFLRQLNVAWVHHRHHR